MKQRSMKSLALAACAGLSACAVVPAPGEPAALKVSVNGETYLLSQLTASTWTATSTGIPKALARTAAGQSGLRQAIEKASGCKVTDSDFSREGRQFDAQVDCGGLSR